MLKLQYDHFRIIKLELQLPSPCMFHEAHWQEHFLSKGLWPCWCTRLSFPLTVKTDTVCRLVLLPGELYLLFSSMHHKVRASDSEKKSGLIAASHCHVSCFACRCYDRVWVLFPWTSVSWDEVWLMSDLSWAPRRDFRQRLQSDGHQRGSDVPLDATRRLGGTSVPRSARVHFWGLLLQFGPLGNLWAGAKTVGCIPNPSIPAG